jgi:hypothetical protein
MVGLLTAAAAIGIGRTRAYELAKNNEFPIPVQRVGTTYRVPVTELLRYLHASEATDQTVVLLMAEYRRASAPAMTLTSPHAPDAAALAHVRAARTASSPRWSGMDGSTATAIRA